MLVVQLVTADESCVYHIVLGHERVREIRPQSLLHPGVHEVFLQHENVLYPTRGHGQQDSHSSQDLAPFNVCLTPKMKEYLMGHHFLSDDEVKTTVNMLNLQQDSNFCPDGLMNMPEGWRRVWTADVIKEK